MKGKGHLKKNDHQKWKKKREKDTKRMEEWKKETRSALKCMADALTLGYCVRIRVRHPLCLFCVSGFSASHQHQYQIDSKIVS